jgi:hypothetical protein
MTKSLAAILAFLLAMCLSAFAAGVFLNSAGAFGLSGAALIPLVALYAAGVLGYKVGGSQLSLEAKVHNLETEKEELKLAVSALVKSLYVIQDGAGRMDGGPSSHQDLIKQYLAPVDHLMSANLYEQVMSDIRITEVILD